MRKIFYFLGIVLACLILVWYFIIRPKIQNLLYKNLVAIAPNLQEQDLNVFPVGFKINKNLDSLFAAFPINLAKPSLQLNMLSLLSLKPGLLFSAQFLNGELSATINSSGVFDQLDTQLVLKQAHLAEHPIIKLCGLTSGTLDIELFAKRKQTADGLPDVKLNFKAQDLEVKAKQRLPSFISRLPVSIPAFNAGQLSLKADCLNGRCKSDSLSFSSSLGEFKGSAEISGVADNPQINMNIDFAFTRDGREQILPLLALLNQRILNTPGRIINLKMRGPLNSSIVSVVARE